MIQKSRIEVYKGEGPHPWRWRARARNGRVTADGSEGYRSKSGVLRALKVVSETIRRGDIEVVEARG